MENPNRHIADAVEDRRLELGMKKQDVASGAGVTPSYLRRVLVGANPLSADVKAGLERALRWPRGHIDRIPRPGPVDAVPAGLKYSQEEWDALDPQDRALLVDLQRKLDERASARASARAANDPSGLRRNPGA